jgi:membrane protease YdiL (CAAX protease family)
MTTPGKKILVFLLLTFGLSSIFYVLILSSGSISSFSFGLMWCPGIAAILTQLIFQRNLRNLGWKAGKLKYWLWSYGLPVIYGLVVYGIVWSTGLGKFAPYDQVIQAAKQLNIDVQSPAIAAVLYVLINATLGVAINMTAALGEEIGWRGLFVPELSRKYSFTGVALISGAVWTIWHAPAILFSDYNNAGAPAWFGLICFALMVVGSSFAYAWLRLKSGSLWPAVILHASHNLFIQAIFTPFTGNTGLTPYVIDEFGLGLALVGLVLAYLFWRKRDVLPVSTIS